MTTQDTSFEAQQRKDLVASDFAVRLRMDTRWSDNDMFGHLNNAVYYQLFDSAINRWVIEGTGTNPLDAAALPLVVESRCSFFSEVGFPEPVDVCIRVQKLGTSSVVYQLGLVSRNDPQEKVAALGQWVHVYVNRDSRRPCPIPAPIRSLLESAETGTESY